MSHAESVPMARWVKLKNGEIIMDRRQLERRDEDTARPAPGWKAFGITMSLLLAALTIWFNYHNQSSFRSDDTSGKLRERVTAVEVEIRAVKEQVVDVKGSVAEVKSYLSPMNAKLDELIGWKRRGLK